MMEQVEFLKHFIAKHTSSIIETKPLQAKVMSSVEESSLVTSKLVPSLGLTCEPSPEPRTSKEIMLHPSKFPIEFKDYGNTSKLSWHEKNIREVSPKAESSKEWLMEVKHSFEAIWILSPSTAMPCSLRETTIEALHSPIVGTSIMLEFLVKNLLGNMPLVPTNKLFKSLLGLFFECCGIARAVPICHTPIKGQYRVHTSYVRPRNSRTHKLTN
jgi:hypothetical protein